MQLEKKNFGHKAAENNSSALQDTVNNTSLDQVKEANRLGGEYAEARSPQHNTLEEHDTTEKEE